MKFVNFKNIKDRTSINPSQLATLIQKEETLGVELTVCMINPKFSFKDKDGKEFAKASKLIVIWPTKNNISKIAGECTDEYTHYEAMFLSGHETASEDYQISFGGLFGYYTNLDDAITAADVCYGAVDQKDLDARQIALNKVWYKMQDKNGRIM